MAKRVGICIYVNVALMVALCAYACFIPAGQLLWDLRDPGLSGRTIPRCAFRWHRALSPRYARWAAARVRSGAAGELTKDNIAGTEWPLFGSVFYLWATEALQDAYEADPNRSRSAPRVYARDAIAAAAALVADPKHAGWVRQHWGDHYLEKENLFYRMLLISALTSYQRLTGDPRYEPLLSSQVESLAAELDASPHGLLDDYPGQCYPVDIVPAIAAIRRADRVLGTDHRAFAARAIRGFQGTRLDEDTGLPAYVVSSRTGRAVDSARGVGLSFMLIWAAELWPETAEQWYRRYGDQFWQEGPWCAGFREYPRGVDLGWLGLQDVDAGPVVAGYGMGASAFGVGALRSLGDADRARRLAAEGLVAAWPLPNGTLLVPRLLSNFADAPYLGEAATLFALTRPALFPLRETGPTGLPGVVYLGLAGLLGLGALESAASVWQLQRWRRHRTRTRVPAPGLQMGLWASLLLAAAVTASVGLSLVGFLCLLVALVLPWRRARPRPTSTGDGAGQSAPTRPDFSDRA